MTRILLKVLYVAPARIMRPTGGVKIARKMWLKVLCAVPAKISRQTGCAKMSNTMLQKVSCALSVIIRRLIGTVISAIGTLLMEIPVKNVEKRLNCFRFISKIISINIFLWDSKMFFQFKIFSFLYSVFV